jgi:exodeoxyribonuclease-5
VSRQGYSRLVKRSIPASPVGNPSAGSSPNTLADDKTSLASGLATTSNTDIDSGESAETMANRTDLLSTRDADGLLQQLQQGVQHGALIEGCAPDYALWRFEDVAQRVFITGYAFNHKKRGHPVAMQGDAARLQLVLNAEWEALRTKHAAPPGTYVGPRATLERMQAGVSATPAHIARPLTEADLSPDQRSVFEALWTFGRAPHSELTLGGLAGTGKSTVVALFARAVAHRRVAFCAPTGKAALGLAQKLTAAGVDLTRNFCGTIHRLIYRPTFDPDTGRLVRVERVNELPYDLLVIDEASMVGGAIYEDLASFGKPMLFVGDHGQLEPITAPGEPSFSLMTRPHLTLERVHRQVAGSPILALAAHVRAGRDPAAFDGFDAAVRLVRARTVERLLELAPELAAGPVEECVLLTRTNRTRNACNRVLRRARGHADTSALAPGDQIVCLRNSYFVSGEDHVLVANGARGSIEAVHEEGEHHVLATVAHADDGVRVRGELLRGQLGRETTLDSYEGLPFDVLGWSDVGLLYDHGYAVTVHKAQGSQFRRVAVVLERGVRSDPRWLYTAVTRATEELVLVDPHG